MNGWRRLRLAYVLYNGHHNVCFSHGWGQSRLGPCPLLIPRLSEFGLPQAIHSISTLPFSPHEYNEWFCKVKIWIHHPQPMPHPGFWGVCGDDFGSSTLAFTPRWSMFGLIQQVHIISTLLTSHCKYNEWLEKIEIGICADHTCVSVTGGVKVGLALVHFWYQDWVSLDCRRQFTASQPFHSLPMSIMNGFARSRFEFIIHNQCHTLDFEVCVVTISAPVP